MGTIDDNSKKKMLSVVERLTLLSFFPERLKSEIRVHFSILPLLRLAKGISLTSCGLERTACSLTGVLSIELTNTGFRFHSVTQSSFENPCTPLEGGFDSQFQGNEQGVPLVTPQWNLTITNDTERKCCSLILRRTTCLQMV